MPSESHVEKECCAYAESLGWATIKLVGEGGKGKPDRVFLHEHAVSVYVEFKKPGETLRKLQIYWKERLEALGFIHYTIDDVGEFKRVFDALTRDINGPK